MERNPKLRSLEAFPVEVEGKHLVCLRDPSGLTENVALVPRPVVALLTLFDGNRSVDEIQVEFFRLHGEIVSQEAIAQLADQLDEALLLESERFRAHRDRITADFLSAPSRPALHAGGSYPADGDTLRELIDGFFQDAEGECAARTSSSAADAPRVSGRLKGRNGASRAAEATIAEKYGQVVIPGRVEQAAGAPGDADAAPEARGARGPLRALVAPHIDFARGGTVYAHAYRPLLLDEQEVDLYVVLGTDHNGDGSLYSLTRKAYETPLGEVATDVEAVDRLARRSSGAAMLRGEVNHRSEHSIEFQAVLLRYLATVRGDQRPPLMLPILCGSFHPFIAEETDPADDSRVTDLCAAVAEITRGRRVVLVAGADLAHVGPHFGDRQPLGPDELFALALDDRKLLDTVVGSDAAAFYERLRSSHDARRVCGLPPIYTMLRLLGHARGEILAYEQCIAGADSGSRVSIAAVVLR